MLDLLAVEQLLGHVLGQVDRDREAEADRARLARRRAGADRGVDRHDVAVEVDQRTAGVARVDRGVGLHGGERGRPGSSRWPTLEVTGRLSAEMMPLVTVLSRPNGEPIATTSWPTLRSAELPSVAGVRPDLPSALMTARSVSGSRTDDLGLGVGAVVERDGQRAVVAGDLDHVVVGEDLAVAADDDAGARAGSS